MQLTGVITPYQLHFYGTRNEAININPNNIEPTITRIEMFLEDGEWENVIAYANAALDYFPTDYRLYKCLLLADMKCKSVSALKNCNTLFALNSNYKKLERYADESTKKEFKEILEYIEKEPIYRQACDTSDIKEATELFKTIRGYKDSDKRISSLQSLIEREVDLKYQAAIELQSKAVTLDDYKQVLDLYDDILNFRNDYTTDKRLIISDRYKEVCKKYNELKLEKDYMDAEELLASGEVLKVKDAKKIFDALKDYKDSVKKAEEAQTILGVEKAKTKKKITILALISTILIISCVSARYVINQNNLKKSYDSGIAHYNAGHYQTAKGIFDELSNYKDSADWSKKCSYSEAIQLYESGDYEEAWDLLKPLSKDGYEDATKWAIKCSDAIKLGDSYNEALYELEDGEFEDAITSFEKLGDFKDSAQMLEKAKECQDAEERLYEFDSDDNADIAQLRKDYNLIKEYLDEDGRIEYNDKLVYCEWPGTYEFESGDIKALSGEDKIKIKKFELEYYILDEYDEDYDDYDWESDHYRIVFNDGVQLEIGQCELDDYGSEYDELRFSANSVEDVFIYRLSENGNLKITNESTGSEAVYKKVTKKK